MSRWRDTLISAAEQWPLQFRAERGSQNWRLIGGNEAVEQEFTTTFAERIYRELKLPPAPDLVVAFLERLLAAGRHTSLSQEVEQLPGRKASATSTRATIAPLRSALIEFVRNAASKKDCKSLTPQKAASGQAAAAKKNRQSAIRLAILRVLQQMAPDPSQWPAFIREFHARHQPRYRQPIVPPPFQPPEFDRLNESPQKWAKKADKAWRLHMEKFLAIRLQWSADGVDEELLPVKRSRGPGLDSTTRKRGENTALRSRYQWAAKYLLGVPVKNIAPLNGPDPSTAARIARSLLKQAGWLKARRPRQGSTNGV